MKKIYASQILVIIFGVLVCISTVIPAAEFLGQEINLLKLVNAIYEENGVLKPTEFGSYLAMVLMKEFYTGMDKVRAAFRDDAKVKSSKKDMTREI